MIDMIAKWVEPSLGSGMGVGLGGVWLERCGIVRPGAAVPLLLAQGEAVGPTGATPPDATTSMPVLRMKRAR